MTRVQQTIPGVPQVGDRINVNRFMARLLTAVGSTLLFLTIVLVFRSLFKSTHLILNFGNDPLLSGKVILFAVPQALARSIPAALLLGMIFSIEKDDGPSPRRSRIVYGAGIFYLATIMALFSMVLLFWVAPRSQQSLQITMSAAADRPMTAADRPPPGDQPRARRVAPGLNEATLSELVERYSDAVFEEKRRLVLGEIGKRLSVPTSCLVLGVLAFVIAGLRKPWKHKAALALGGTVLYYAVAAASERIVLAGISPLWPILLLPNALLLAAALILSRKT